MRIWADIHMVDFETIGLDTQLEKVIGNESPACWTKTHLWVANIDWPLANKSPLSLLGELRVLESWRNFGYPVQQQFSCGSRRCPAYRLGSRIDELLHYRALSCLVVNAAN